MSITGGDASTTGGADMVELLLLHPAMLNRMAMPNAARIERNKKGGISGSLDR